MMTFNEWYEYYKSHNKNHGMVSYFPFFRLQQGEGQGIETFTKLLHISYEKEYHEDWMCPERSIVLLYQFATGLKDDRLRRFAVHWIRKHRNKNPRFYDLVYGVERERLKNYKMYPVRKWKWKRSY